MSKNTIIHIPKYSTVYLANAPNSIWDTKPRLLTIKQITLASFKHNLLRILSTAKRIKFFTSHAYKLNIIIYIHT